MAQSILDASKGQARRRTVSSARTDGSRVWNPDGIAGISKVGNIRNKDFREALNIKSLLLMRKKQQIRWYGRVLRMPPEPTAQKVLLTSPEKKTIIWETTSLMDQSDQWTL